MKLGFQRRTPVTTLAVATIASTLGALPVWLTGALAVFIGAELGFGAAQHGASVSVYFASASLSSWFAGLLAERAGARRAVSIALAMAAFALAGVALVARSWWHLVPFLVVAGVGSAVMQPATNLALARAVPSARQGVSFGLKQASIPLATLVAGAAVPALGVTFGWRTAFLIAGVSMAAFVVALPVLPTDRPVGRQHPRLRGQVRPSLLVMTAGAGLGVAAATSMSAFTVTAGVARGLSPGHAGLVLAFGSALAGVSRVVAGWLADRRGGRHLPRVATMLALGALGSSVLSLSTTTGVYVAAVAIMFGAGWGWNGLFIFSVVRQYANIPAVATGVSQVGIRAGGVLGPLGFGAIAARGSDGPAWLALSACLAVGALLILVGRRMVHRERSHHRRITTPQRA